MKYDMKQIMTDAWMLVKQFAYTISDALKAAWKNAKAAAKRTIRVSEWFITKAQKSASAYNTFIDYERNEEGLVMVINGKVTVFVDEYIAETEKAVKVRLQTGAVVGSVKGWTLWVPKSQIA